MKNMKYDIGDKVRIKSIDWYNENKKKELRSCIECGNMMFTPQMSKWCGKIVTIIRIENNCYMDENARYWTDEMIEGLVEEETKTLTTEKMDKVIEEAKTYWDSIKDAWICPEGYQFKDENGNVINATKIVLEKKKKEYPKTYEECYKIIGVKLSDCYIQGYKSPLLEDLQELLICRDAYWKLYGEENGLGKPWEPDWKDDTTHKFIIHTIKDKIHCGVSLVKNHLLAFPTEEMRDAFYENFKELINECKELL